MWDPLCKKRNIYSNRKSKMTKGSEGVITRLGFQVELQVIWTVNVSPVR